MIGLATGTADRAATGRCARRPEELLGNKLARAASTKQAFEYTVLRGKRQPSRSSPMRPAYASADCVALEQGQYVNLARWLPIRGCTPRAKPSATATRHASERTGGERTKWPTPRTTRASTSPSGRCVCCAPTDSTATFTRVLSCPQASANERLNGRSGRGGLSASRPAALSLRSQLRLLEMWRTAGSFALAEPSSYDSEPQEPIDDADSGARVWNVAQV